MLKQGSMCDNLNYCVPAPVNFASPSWIFPTPFVFFISERGWWWTLSVSCFEKRATFSCSVGFRILEQFAVGLFDWTVCNSSVSIVDWHGHTKLQERLEKQLSASYLSTEVADWIRKALVILLSRLAVQKTCMPSITTRLIDALKTPSELVCGGWMFISSGGSLGDRTSTLLKDLLGLWEVAE